MDEKFFDSLANFRIGRPSYTPPRRHVENYTLNRERVFEINFYTLFSFFIHSIFLINENFNGGGGNELSGKFNFRANKN